MSVSDLTKCNFQHNWNYSKLFLQSGDDDLPQSLLREWNSEVS